MKRNILLFKGFVISLCCLIFLANLVFSQEKLLSIQRIDVSQLPEIRIYFTVIDQNNDSVLGLTAHEFKVLIDGIPQQNIILRSALQGGEFLSVALLFDRSGSMRNALEQTKEAAIAFLRRVSEEDQIAIISFDDNVKVDTEFSKDRVILESAIRNIDLGKDTAIYDAIGIALDLFQKAASKRQAIIILSDGKDTRSKSNKNDILQKVKNADISLYTIGLGDQTDENTLRELAGKTGGSFLKAVDPADLLRLYQLIADQLNNQYLLTFSSSLTEDKKGHDLELLLEEPSGQTLSEKKKYIASRGSGYSSQVLDEAEGEEKINTIIMLALFGGIIGLALGLLIVFLLKILRPEICLSSILVIGLVFSALFLGAILGIFFAYM